MKRNNICYNVDEPWKHYVKWKKLDQKAHIFQAGNEKEPDNKTETLGKIEKKPKEDKNGSKEEKVINFVK